VVITAAIWSVRNPIKCYSTQKAVTMATIVGWIYYKELLRESVLHLGVCISTSLAFYAYLALIRWRKVIQGVYFNAVPSNAAVTGCPSAFRLSMPITLIGEAIKETPWRIKIQIYFTFTQHLKLTSARKDRGLNFMALLQYKLHQGHK